MQLVWDCYAWSAWQFFQIPHKDGTYHDIPGDWKHYSGDFPLWRMSYDIIRYFRDKFEHEMEWSFQRLFLMPPDVDKMILQMRLEGVTLQEIAQAVGYKTASAVAKRIEKIAGRYEDFAEAEYHDFLEKHK